MRGNTGGEISYHKDGMNDMIMSIHKIVRYSYLERRLKLKSKSAYNLAVLGKSPVKSTLLMHRDLPKLNVNVGKDKKEYVQAKRAKKSIKQNIL